ncbi:MAG TPA: hypothetical protein VGK46_06330 [Saprospiraceae bacterium]
MKSQLLFIFILFVALQTGFNQSIGLGTLAPHASALLDISSTTKGALLPRMTSAQRTTIPTPATGLMVYDTDLSKLYFYNGSSWNAVAGNGGFTLPYEGTVNVAGAAFRVNNNGGVAIEGNSTSSFGVDARSTTGHGLNALSYSGHGVMASSTTNSAVFAFTNNDLPTISATNSNGAGVAIKGSSGLHHAVLGVSGGLAKSGVRGEATGASGAGVFGTASQATGIGVYGNVTSGIGVYGFATTGTGMRASSGTGLALEVLGKVKISGGNTNPTNGAVLTSDASGNAVWKNNKVAFSARAISPEISNLADGYWLKVEFGTEEYDYTNSFVETSGAPWSGSCKFTAPKNGLYHFDAGCNVAIFSSSDSECKIALKLKRNGVESTIAADLAAPSEYWSSWVDLNPSISRDVKLLVGDVVWVEIVQHNTDEEEGLIFGSNSGHHSYFNGHLVFED